MQREDDRKAAAAQLARLLERNDGAAILKLLRRLDLIAPRADDAARRTEPVGPPADHGPIGLWRPIVKGNLVVEYVRDERNLEALVEGMWSTARRIPAKGRLKRVVWLGESVARGFLLDPCYAPAPVLQDVLDAAIGREAVDVVDLARTAQAPSKLLALMQDSTRLSPDAFVVFAGNNLMFDALRHLRWALDGKVSLRAINALAAGALVELARDFVDGIAAIAGNCGVPAVLVVPDFNVGDWSSGVDRPPLLDPDANRAWRELHARATAALRLKDFEQAEAAAAAMCDLDEGCSTTSLRIRAHCRVQQGDLSEARRLFEEARDAELWKCAGHLVAGERSELLMPRCFRVVQDALRQRAAERGLSLVDLPRRLAEWLDDGISDRRVFIDHCHLTVAGIRVAVASVAERLLAVFGGEPVSWRTLKDLCRPIGDAAVGRAHLEAAVTAACWGQEVELIRYHANLAASLAPELAGACHQLLEFGTRAGVPLFSRAGDRILNANEVSTSRAMMLVGRMNVQLSDIVAESFRAIDPALAERIDEIRKEEFGVSARTIDLLDPVFCTFDYVHPEVGWPGRSAFYKAYGHESRFVFVSDRPSLLELVLTARTRPQSGRISILINGTTVSEPTVGPDWTTVRFACEPSLLRDGINEAVIRWPSASCSVDVTRRDGNRFYPLVGEIFRFSVSVRAGAAESTDALAALRAASSEAVPASEVL
jgi:hypothetical protein